LLSQSRFFHVLQRRDGDGPGIIGDAEDAGQNVAGGDAETLNGIGLPLRTLIGLQVCALREDLEGGADFVAHAFTGKAADFPTAHFVEMKPREQGGDSAGDESYGDTVEPPGPDAAVSLDENTAGEHNSKGG
jgi:hypothetical protein